jgi:hypothetical protein
MLSHCRDAFRDVQAEVAIASLPTRSTNRKCS